jgi:cell division protein FtsB
MQRKQHTINNKKRFGSRAILAALVGFSVFFLLLSSVIGLWEKYMAIRAHIKELKQQEVILKQKKDKVTDMNKYLETTEGKEEIFRDTYRLVKPGEGIVVITSDDKESVVSKKPAILRFWDTIMRGLGL